MSSSSPSRNQDNSLQIDNCVWTISVTNCFGQEYFQVIYGVTTYLSLFVFLCSIWLLSWRLYSKPDTMLFKLKGFLTLEGYLFMQIFWGVARVVSCIILIYNLFPAQLIVHEVVLDVSWFLGLVSVVTYLAGVLRTIPRMNFYRQNPHYKHSLHLPNLRGIVGVYASYIIVLGTISITSAVLTGYFRQYPVKNSVQIIKIIMAIHYSACSIGCFLVAAGFLVYGNQLVGIAKEGLHLLEGVSGYPSKGSHDHSRRTTYVMGAELELKHKKLQRSVRKMRIINVAFILTFLVLSVILGSFAFFNEQIINNIEISKVIAGVTNLLPMILNVAVMAGIAYGEMKVPDKSEPRLDNIVAPMNSNPISPVIERISSDVESLSHSRNNSTDSDAPLLRWPAPVVTNSARRGSAQLDSPISVTFGTSALATSSTFPPPA